MKREAILSYYICNGNIVATHNSKAFDEITSTTIYEVIRIIDGVPLYLEEHLERMKKSAKLIGCRINKSDGDITEEIFKLVKVNNCKNLNIKLICSDLHKKEQIFLIYFIESYYPKREIYQKGIHTILFHRERENPNVKIANTNLRENANKEIKAKDAFEALLVNEKGYITEGSRSNIFFVKGNKVYTAPAGEVLLGVTRSKIVSICMKLDIEVIEEHIHKANLDELDGAFMTGTSVDVLPITSIDDKKYNSVDNQVVRRISEEYIKNADKYIRDKGDISRQPI